MLGDDRPKRELSIDVLQYPPLISWDTPFKLKYGDGHHFLEPLAE